MSFIFGFLDILLAIILLFDTLGLVYQIRKEGEDKCNKNDYIRVCLSWILFLTICNLFTCNGKGYFCAILRIIFFLAKAFVTLPICKGTLKIHDYLIEKEKAKEWFYKIAGLVNEGIKKIILCLKQLKQKILSLFKKNDKKIRFD